MTVLQGLAELILTWVRSVCRLSERPELRACAKVVAILQPSRKRGSIVGVVREDPFGNALLLMPCDPRMPMCLIRSSELPADLKASLKVTSALGYRGSQWSSQRLIMVTSHFAGLH